MWNDPIVEEVRKIREQHASKFDYDLNAIYKDLKETEKQSDHEVINLPAKRIL